MSFHFIGQVGASKSMLNRALILKSHSADLKLAHHGHLSQADDVKLMAEALEKLEGRNTLTHKQSRDFLELNCGHAGTVLRFLALRVAREKGRFRLKGSTRLFSRPLEDLKKVLMQLGSVVTVGSDYIDIESDGWHVLGDQLYIPADKSSQFVSGFLMNAWDLPFEVFFRTTAKRVSEPYLQMTWEMVQALGMKIDVMGEGEYHLSARQKLYAKDFALEPDMSSAFALAACATVAGELRLTDWPKQSLQADFRFVQILKKMGVTLKEESGRLEISKTEILKPVKMDLMAAPDLFPVLVSLCALADGPSEFVGIQHLAYKESSRAENMRDLLRLSGVECKHEGDKFVVFGRGLGPFKVQPFKFDPDEDHRIYMAASVLKLAGVPVEVLHPEVVNKSFPEFVKIVESSQ